MACSRVDCTATTYWHTHIQCLTYNSLCLLKLWVCICVSRSSVVWKTLGTNGEFLVRNALCCVLCSPFVMFITNCLRMTTHNGRNMSRWHTARTKRILVHSIYYVEYVCVCVCVCNLMKVIMYQNYQNWMYFDMQCYAIACVLPICRSHIQYTPSSLCTFLSQTAYNIVTKQKQ